MTALVPCGDGDGDGNGNGKGDRHGGVTTSGIESPPPPRGRGLPIGNLTSQWWGNVYLDGLDHHVCRGLRVGAWQRYMDDMTAFDDDRGRLVELRARVGAWLARERGLTLKEPDAPVRRTDGVCSYLGYRVWRGGFTLGEKARQRLPRRVRAAWDEPARVRAVLAAARAAWSFG